jgi:dynein heavy chain, axonemal
MDRILFNSYGNFYFKDQIFTTTTEPVFYDLVVETAGEKSKFKYKIPSNKQAEITRYIDFIKTVPATDNPEVFGLHANADLTFRLKESLEMINTIIETRPKDSNAGGGKTREEIVQEKAKDLLGKLPPDYVDNEVKDQCRKLPGPKTLPDKGLSVPLNIFLY